MCECNCPVPATTSSLLKPRYLLTSLALNDLTIGLLITPFGLLPALFHCWPYGEIFCQIQVSQFFLHYKILNRRQGMLIKNKKGIYYEQRIRRRIFCHK